MIGYIYKITNLVNGKIYIGQTTRNIEKRFKEHLACHKISSKDLTRAIKEFGKEAFIIELLEEVEVLSAEEAMSEKDTLTEAEERYIEQYQSNCHNKGYNRTMEGIGFCKWFPVAKLDMDYENDFSHLEDWFVERIM